MLQFLLPSKRFERFDFLKGGDSWFVVYFIDVFAVPIVLLSRKWGVKVLTPDSFSILSLWLFLLGLISLYLEGGGMAAPFFFGSAVLDCVDGKYARSLSLQSKHGAILDAACDCIKHGFGFLLIAVWFYVNDNLISTILVVFWSALLCIAHMSSIGAYANSDAMQLRHDAQSKENDCQKEDSAWASFCYRRGLVLSPFTTAEMAFLVVPIISINVKEPLYPLLLGTAAYFMLIFFRFLIVCFKKDTHNEVSA